MLRKSLQALPRHRDFTFLPAFFSLVEQRVLLTTALQKLDAMETIQNRRRRKTLLRAGRPTLPPNPSNPLHDAFFPDEYYEFQEGHFDGVIHNFREMHLTSWPTSDVPELSPILGRLNSLFPAQDVQTHLLHLASTGEIHPHVDNLSASGTWILGVSLGSERLLHLEGQDADTDSFDVLLPSGSVYIQRRVAGTSHTATIILIFLFSDSFRFGYKHSIPLNGTYEGREIPGGQRLSIMIRVRGRPALPT
ncbi:hypothetical protein C8R46DRAFT_883173 [Mycena filopes]|nr:hypothetical protein C8R46DRAFT_883173 [Mycena filopes]